MKRNILSDVEPEHYFWLNDGTAIKNLSELYNSIGTMSNDVFNHHVNEQRNDFCNWVRDVHKDKRLAENLLKSKTREEMLVHIKHRIDEAENEAIRARAHTARPAEKKAVKHAKAKIAERKHKEVSAKPEEETRHRDRIYTISGTAIALAALVGVVALINLFEGRPSATGAVVADVSVGYNWFAITGTVAIITVLAVFSRKKNKPK